MKRLFLLLAVCGIAFLSNGCSKPNEPIEEPGIETPGDDPTPDPEPQPEPDPEPDPEPEPEPETPSIPVTFNEKAGANCYVVVPGNTVEIPLLKGCTETALEGIENAVVLWETLGTLDYPETGDVVSSATLSDGKLSVVAGSKEGNALVAVKNAEGTILWSWHIWVCNFNPESSCIDFNSKAGGKAGTMMDRNLGALTTNPEDVRSFGLFYQWGRKDPFLGSASLSEDYTPAVSTGVWPENVKSSSSKGTIEYSIAHPTTFITHNNSNMDWQVNGEKYDNTRWPNSNSAKGIYDPCPKGWRIPDGGKNGFWAKVFGTTSSVGNPDWEKYNHGVFFPYDNGSGFWLPSCGQKWTTEGTIKDVADWGVYACTTDEDSANDMTTITSLSILNDHFLFTPADNYFARATGRSVRCVREVYE